MSELTYLNRWQRYQAARLQGLIDGFMSEARRLSGDKHQPAIQMLGTALLADLQAQCDRMRKDIKGGMRVQIPEIRFERL